MIFQSIGKHNNLLCMYILNIRCIAEIGEIACLFKYNDLYLPIVSSWWWKCEI